MLVDSLWSLVDSEGPLLIVLYILPRGTLSRFEEVEEDEIDIE